ncbi:MAG TPA: PAS domain S-box protein [Pirellulaceae bacterium]|jgi:PAS domain S-box-containing protein|nr:PAS domain S-box protein [Pirellulaceae bacterium]
MNERAGAVAADRNELFRLLVENVLDYAIFVIDSDGRLQTWSDGAARLLGYNDLEILGELSDKLYTPEDVQDGVPAKERQQALATGRGEDDRWYVRKNGSRFWAGGVMTPLWDENRTLRGFAKIMRDRTEWKLAEEARVDSEARRAAVLETSLDGIVTIDHEDRLVEFNPAAERIFGYRREDVLGRRMAELIVPARLRQDHYRGMARFLATGEGPVLGKRLRLPALRADGSEFPAELAIVRVPKEGPPHFTGYILDITGRDAEERWRAVQLAVTQALAEAPTVQDAAPLVLQAVCDNLGWDVGGFWLADSTSKTLRCLDVWSRSDAGADRFAEASRPLVLTLGEGLPGRVWQRREPFSIADVSLDVNFPRLALAAAAGLRGALAVPVMLGTEALGVIELLRRSPLIPDDDLLARLATLGGHVGQFLGRKANEERLLESEEKFRHMADTIPQLTWMARGDGSIFWYNRRWYEYTGTTAEDMEGWGWQTVHDPAVLPHVLQRWKESLATGEPFDMVFPLRGADGRFRPFLTRVNPLRDEEGGVRYWFGTNTDISEQKQAEDAASFLADASAALAAVVDCRSTLQKVAWLAVPRFGEWCAIDLVEEGGSLRRLAVAHVDPAKVHLAHDLHRRYPPDPNALVGAPHVARTGEPEICEDIPDSLLEAVAQDAEHLRILRELGLNSYLCVPLKTAGRTLAVITLVAGQGRRYGAADLALAEQLAGRAAVAIENTRLYDELRDADRRKDEFLAMLAHELRNPLAPIRSGLDLLEMMGTDEQIVEPMQQQVEQLVRLVDDLLDVSRIMRGKVELRKQSVDLSAVVARAVETARPVIQAHGHSFSQFLPSESTALDADPVRLAQAISNLLNNAAKYTERGGRIELTAKREGDQVRIEVRDDGIGMEADLLPRVFDLFTQAERAIDRSQGGLGIGLTVVKSLVEMHGGSVTAHSEGLGYGSAFTVRLPINLESVAGPRSEALAGTGGAYRILVVDDNVPASKMLAMLLDRLGGHEVVTAQDGPAALEAAVAHRPHIIFLDIGLPKMDGYEVARRLRERPELETTLVVALTGYGSEADRRKTLHAGCDDHLVKPPSVKDLRYVLTHRKLTPGN